MDDVLTLIYNELRKDSFILENVENRIKYYEYPETGDVSGPYIIIDPLDAPAPSDFADDTWLTHDWLFQIDIWTKNRRLTKELSLKMLKVLWDMGFRPFGGSGDEWDKNTGIFRETRRFRGKIYRHLIKGEKNK